MKRVGDEQLNRDLEAEFEGYQPLDLLISGPRPAKFVAGEPNGQRIRVRYFWRARENRMKGRVWFGPGAEGPPGYAHGGAVAALLDEVMGISAWASGYKVLAADINIRFRRPTPLSEILTFTGEVERTEGRKIYCLGKVYNSDGELIASGEGLFMNLKEEMLEELRSKLDEIPSWLQPA